MFQPWTGLQRACSPKCAIQIVEDKKKKKRRAETREMRKRYNENDRTYQLKQATTACHRYILMRDERAGCISCGIRTGQMTAGHFFTVGSSPELRYHEDNISKQCGQCNFHKSGNVAIYRVNLEAKIGRDRVENLDRCRHNTQNLTLDDIKDIQWWYKQKLKWLQEERENSSI
jgi:putative salt-induced outer membrane protein YdiY